MNRALVWAEKLLSKAPGRERLLDELLDHIRYELRATEYTSISPVSGLLNIIALWAADPNDEASARALERIAT